MSWFNPISGEFVGLPKDIQVVYENNSGFRCVLNMPYDILIGAYCLQNRIHHHPFPEYDGSEILKGRKIFGNKGYYSIDYDLSKFDRSLSSTDKKYVEIRIEPTDIIIILENGRRKFGFSNPFSNVVNDILDIKKNDPVTKAFLPFVEEIRKTHRHIPEEYIKMMTFASHSEEEQPPPSPSPEPKESWRVKQRKLGLPDHFFIPFPDSDVSLAMPVEAFVYTFRSDLVVSLPKDLEPEYQLNRTRQDGDFFTKETLPGTIISVYQSYFLLTFEDYKIIFNSSFFTFFKNNQKVASVSALVIKKQEWFSSCRKYVEDPEFKTL